MNSYSLMKNPCGLGVCVFENEVADFVAEVIHQLALLDRINLVEGTSDMEADGILCVTPCQSPSTEARVEGAASGVASTDSPVARMNTGYSPSGRRL